MKLKLLLDEDVQVELEEALKRKGVDAVAVEQLGRKGLGDNEQLEFASGSGRTIFTYNVGDYVKLHKKFTQQDRNHRGIIVSKQLSIGEALRRLLNLVTVLSAEEIKNRLEFLSNWRKADSNSSRSGR